MMKESHTVDNPLGIPDEQWRKKLTPEQYSICRLQGTERPGSGKFVKYKGNGTFTCVACGAELFDAKTKFESGTGWPSFYDPIVKERIREVRDTSHGAERVEVRCAKCDSHLGHVFDDGPKPTGLRYCINSLSLDVKEPPPTAPEKK